MTREWIKPDRRLGISLGWDGLTWWYADHVFSDSGHVLGNFHRFRMAVRMYRKGGSRCA